MCSLEPFQFLRHPENDVSMKNEQMRKAIKLEPIKRKDDIPKGTPWTFSVAWQILTI